MKKLLKANEKKNLREVTQKGRKENREEDGYNNSNYSNLLRENNHVAKESSGQDKSYFQRFSTSKKSLGKVKSTSFADNEYFSNNQPSTKLKKYTKRDSNSCFTKPEESKRKVRIIRKNTQTNRVAPVGILIDRTLRPISSKNKRAYKKVSFDDIKNIYGSTPENTSSESSETFPYNKYDHYVFQAHDIDSPDKAFAIQDKIRFVGKDYDDIINPQAKNLSNEQKLTLDVSPPRDSHSKEIYNEMSMVPVADGGLLKFSSKNLAEIKSGHEGMAVNSSCDNGTSPPPLIMNNADSTKTTEHKAFNDTKTTSRNSNNNKMMLADTLNRKYSFDSNKSFEILKSAKTQTTIKSKTSPLVSSIPKPSVYINRDPVTLSNRGVFTSGVKPGSPVAVSIKGTDASTSGGKPNSPVAISTKGTGAPNSGVKPNSPVALSTKGMGASTSGVKSSSPVALSTKGTGAPNSGVKPNSPVALSTKDMGASTSGVKSSSPVALSTKDTGASTSGVKISSPVAIYTKSTGTSTSGVKPSSPDMDILDGSSISRDFASLDEDKIHHNKKKSLLPNEPLNKPQDIRNMNIDYYETDYTAKPSLSLDQQLNKGTENKVTTKTVEDSLKSGTENENVSSYSKSYKDPNEKDIKTCSNDIIPSDNKYSNSTNVLSFPGFVGNKTPFQNGYNTKKAFAEEFEYVTENGYKQENNISRNLLEPSKINSEQHEDKLVTVQTIISELSSPGFKLGGDIQNKTFNVFYESARKTGGENNTFNLPKNKEQDPKEMEKFLNKDNMSLGNGPKGLLIFVNKKTVIDSFGDFDDASLLTRKDFPIHTSYRQNSSKYDDPRIKRLLTKSSGDSLRKPYTSSEWDSGKPSPKSKDTDKRSRPKSNSDDRLGRSGLFSRYFDKLRHTFGAPADKRDKESNISDEVFEGHIYPSISKKTNKSLPSKIGSFARPKTEGSKKSSPIYTRDGYPKTEGSKKSGPIYTRHGYPKGSSDVGVSSQDKPLIVERSPSGAKITEKYPCGCLRIIFTDKDNELETEEFISAFCRDGSLCEIQHPELQQTRRIIEIPAKSSVSDETISGPLSRCWFPNIEIVADGIISKNKIPERPPAPTMKGAKLSGSINIKTDKVNGVCNLYFDPRLLRYLIANIDEVKAVAEEFREH